MSERSKAGTALITGASTGIGATYADRLARRGYDLVLVARDEARLNDLAARLRDQAGVAVDVLKADLTLPVGRGVVERRLLEDTAISLLVNNAGMAVHGRLIDIDPDAVEKMIVLNTIAVTRLAGAAARAFAARGAGAIINIASVLALAPETFNGVYSGTKAFVLNLTQSMHQELAAAGVQMQVVLPGATRTEIWSRAGTDISKFPPSMLMEVDEMVDAALVGFDRHELVTIPSLPDETDWHRFHAARLALAPNLSRDRAAARYTGSAR